MVPAKTCGRFWARLVLLSISVLHTVHPQNPWDFRRKHVTLLEKIDHNQCNSEMTNKRIAQTPSGCKPINTFIHAPESQVDQACAVGKPYVINNLEFKRSTQKFRVTNCRLSLSDVNECKYVAEADRWRYIVVTCDQNGRPVHLAKTLADDLVGKQDDQTINNTARALNSYVPCFWAGLLFFSIAFAWWF